MDLGEHIGAPVYKAGMNVDEVCTSTNHLLSRCIVRNTAHADNRKAEMTGGRVQFIDHGRSNDELDCDDDTGWLASSRSASRRCAPFALVLPEQASRSV